MKLPIQILILMMVINMTSNSFWRHNLLCILFWSLLFRQTKEENWSMSLKGMRGPLFPSSTITILSPILLSIYTAKKAFVFPGIFFKNIPIQENVVSLPDLPSQHVSHYSRVWLLTFFQWTGLKCYKKCFSFLIFWYCCI